MHKEMRKNVSSFLTKTINLIIEIFADFKFDALMGDHYLIYANTQRVTECWMCGSASHIVIPPKKKLEIVVYYAVKKLEIVVYHLKKIGNCCILRRKKSWKLLYTTSEKVKIVVYYALKNWKWLYTTP